MQERIARLNEERIAAQRRADAMAAAAAATVVPHVDAAAVAASAAAAENTAALKLLQAITEQVSDLQKSQQRVEEGPPEVDVASVASCNEGLLLLRVDEGAAKATMEEFKALLDELNQRIQETAKQLCSAQLASSVLVSGMRDSTSLWGIRNSIDEERQQQQHQQQQVAVEQMHTPGDDRVMPQQLPLQQEPCKKRDQGRQQRQRMQPEEQQNRQNQAGGRPYEAENDASSTAWSGGDSWDVDFSVEHSRKGVHASAGAVSMPAEARLVSAGEDASALHALERGGTRICASNVTEQRPVKRILQHVNSVRRRHHHLQKDNQQQLQALL
ncbi:hypothetical protein cyc_08880 [Cyclospora cayetanensis]|uniref:Uncharacterized protein n=1 Tax=Cyclospora cayetanensis TaxID=88456 RepID=A0A1D3D5L8_9EIME|nr:hypothetical protein cyc_08880 [Cyclospora cayetanensis]